MRQITLFRAEGPKLGGRGPVFISGQPGQLQAVRRRKPSGSLPRMRRHQDLECGDVDCHDKQFPVAPKPPGKSGSIFSTAIVVALSEVIVKSFDEVVDLKRLSRCGTNLLRR